MTTTHEGGALVALKDAAQSLGITRQALAQRIERRGISPMRRMERGRALVYLSEAMLEELRASPEDAGARQGEQARQGGELVEDLARLRRESLVRDLGRQEAVIGLLREQRAVRRSWMARLLGRG